MLFIEGYFENSNIKYKGNYVKGKRQGVWMYWNVDKRVVLKGEYNKGLREGVWTRSFREGEMKMYFNNGVLEGKQFGGIERR